MKISKNVNRNSLKFITLAVLSSVAFSSLTVTAQPAPKITNAYKDALTDSIKTEPNEITAILILTSTPR